MYLKAHLVLLVARCSTRKTSLPFRMTHYSLRIFTASSQLKHPDKSKFEPSKRLHSHKKLPPNSVVAHRLSPQICTFSVGVGAFDDPPPNQTNFRWDRRLDCPQKREPKLSFGAIQLPLAKFVYRNRLFLALWQL